MAGPSRVAHRPPPPHPVVLPIIRLILFHAFVIPSVLLMLPLSAIRYLLPSLRPNPRSSLLKTLHIAVVRLAIRNMIRFRMQPIAPRQGGIRERWGALGTAIDVANQAGMGGYVEINGKRVRSAEGVWIDPPSANELKGILTVEGQPKSGTYSGPALVTQQWANTPVKGYWFMHKPGAEPGPAAVKKDRPVILYFHGGAYVTFSACDPHMGQSLAKNLALTSQADVLSIDYNLAPYAPFPIQLLQALSGYFYLTRTLGYPPSRVFVGGDSAGGHLTLQLERYLRTELQVPAEQRPAGLVLFSPAVDFGPLGLARPTWRTNRPKDYLWPEFLKWGLDSLRVGPEHKDRCPLPLTHPWFSPVRMDTKDYSELSPIYLANGGDECLAHEDREFVQKAKAAGVDLVHDEMPNCPHDFFTLAPFIGESKAVYRRLGPWLERVSAGKSAYKIGA